MSRSRCSTWTRPTRAGGYRHGLELLANVPGVRLLVPGHGHVGDRAEFRRRVAADRAYLDATSPAPTRPTRASPRTGFAPSTPATKNAGLTPNNHVSAVAHRATRFGAVGHSAIS